MCKNWTLLTGATGFVGREILKRLVGHGENVAVLIRGSKTKLPHERFTNLLRACGFTRPQITKVMRIDGDVSQSPIYFDKASTDSFGWLENYCKRVIHCAGDVSFNPNHNPSKINVDGTRNVLATMDAIGIKELHHVSTAYVCGEAKGKIIREEPLPGIPKNLYESSKVEAEKLVYLWHDRFGYCTTIYRPTIVVGDSKTGATTCFNGFYNLVRLAAMLASGVGKFTINNVDKLTIPLMGEEPVNLVPVDRVAETIIHVMLHSELQGRIYHVTPPKAPSAQMVANVLGRYFGFGDKIVFNPEAKLEELTLVDRKLPELLGPYGQYFGTDPFFNTINMDRVAVSFEVQWDQFLTRAVDYAVSNNFRSQTL